MALVEALYHALWTIIGFAALFDIGRSVYMALAHKRRVVPLGGGIFWLTVMLANIYGGHP